MDDDNRGFPYFKRNSLDKFKDHDLQQKNAAITCTQVKACVLMPSILMNNADESMQTVA